MILKAKRTNGYDSEELYFEKLNRELIARLHQEAPKAEETQNTGEPETNNVLEFKTRSTTTEKKAA